jgi:glycosyltransferase involved in cell wall biosynthesis
MSGAGRPSVSVVIPARNEEGNLKPCLEVVVAALDDAFAEWEIIIVDDGSTDGTGALAERLASESDRLRVVRLDGRGFAAAYRRGLALATCEYVALIPGDNEIQPLSVRAIFEAVGTADVIVPFTANQADRPWLRRTLSRAFTTTVNTLFGFRLRYYQGPCVYPVELVRRLPVTTTGFAFLAEMLVRALTSGCRGVEVPMHIQPRASGRSKAVSLHNVVTALRTLVVLVWDVKVRRAPLR